MVKISAALPTHMKAVVLKDYDGTPQSVAAADFSVPRLRSGQVLIKLAASPIGPADLMFLKGQYGITKPLPVAPGFEGSGTVIASGGGWLGWGLVGKPVACLALEDGHGTWAGIHGHLSGPLHPLVQTHFVRTGPLPDHQPDDGLRVGRNRPNRRPSMALG